MLNTNPNSLSQFFPKVLVYFFRTLDNANNSNTYFVGGSVRDAIIWRIPHDFDIEIFGVYPEALTNYLNAVCGEKNVKVAGNGFPVWMVNVPNFDGEVQIALPRNERVKTVSYKDFVVTVNPFMTLKEAGERRDFTMNSLYMNTSFEIVDNFGGLRDLEQSILRPTSPKFMEDPLRVYRAMRFLSQFALIPSNTLLQYSMNLLPYAQNLEKDVIAREWQKWSETKYPQNGIEFLRNCGWLSLYPQLQILTIIPQSSLHHPEGSVYNHTLLVLGEVQQFSTPETRSLLTFAALCHDMGKAVTTIVENPTKVTAKGHEEFSAEFSKNFLNSIHPTFFNKVQPKVSELCQYHMRFHSFDEISKRTVRRVIASLKHNSLDDLISLISCDILGRKLKDVDYSIAKSLVEFLYNIAQDAKNSNDLLNSDNSIKRIINGYFLIEKGLIPGKEFGGILKDALDAQIEEILTADNREVWWNSYTSK